MTTHHRKAVLLLISFALTGIFDSLGAVAVYDADEYLYYGTYNSGRNLLYVGVNDLTPGSPYQYHFNFAAVQFDLAGLSAGGTSYLQLSLMRFRVPGPVVPNSPPSYTYATSGYSFDLKVVALGDDFLEAGILSGSALQEWYANNLWNRPTVGIMNFNSAGAVSLDVSSAVDAWLANPASNFGFGLVGVTSGTQGLTAQFYSTENAVSSSNAPALIPEPSNLALWGFAYLFVALAFRKRNNSFPV